MAKEYRVKLVVDGTAEGGLRAVKDTGEAIDKLDRKQARSVRRSKAMARAMVNTRTAAKGLALTTTAAAAGLAAITRSSIASTKEADTLAKAIGVSTGSLQEFQYAAEQAGIGADKASDIVKDLADKIGDAALTGGGELAEVLNRIGLSAGALQKSAPVDQLIAIGDAIKDLPASQQVNVLESVADDATMLLPLLRDNARLLREYSQEAKDFGIALGNDDVARLMAADRATKRFSGAMRGLGNDIAIAVAPALTSSINDMSYLRDIVGDSGFQNNLATLASAFARTAGFLAEGTREYVTFGQQIGTAAAHLAGYSNELEDIDAKIQRLQSMRGSSVMSRAGLFNFGEGFDTYIDDADIDRYIQKLKAQRAKIAGAMGSVGARSTAPASLETVEIKPGRFDVLVDQFDKAHEKLVKLRKDRAELQEAVAQDPSNAAYRRSLAEVNDQIERLGQGSRTAAKTLTDQQRAAQQLTDQYQSAAGTLRQSIALFDKSGHEAEWRYQIEQGGLRRLDPVRQQNILSLGRELDALEAQRTALQSLFPEWEKLNQAQQLRSSVSALPENMQAFGQRRVAQMLQESATEGLPGMQGLAAEFNGPFGEESRLEAERAQYEEKYQQRLEAFQEFARTHQDQKAEADAAIEALESDHQQRMRQYDDQTAKARRAGYQSLYGDITDIVGTFAGRQSGIYQTMFAASKAFAIADSTVQIAGALAKAANNPFPANLAFMGTVAAQTASIVSTISSTTMSGQAHDGIDHVPNTGTWNLERGERVIDRRTNVDLKQYLQRENTGTAQKQGGGAGSPVFNITMNVQAQAGVSDEDARRQARVMGQTFREEVRGVMVNEMRPGGMLANVKRPA